MNPYNPLGQRMKVDECRGTWRGITALMAAACVMIALDAGKAPASVPTGIPTFSDPLNITNLYQPFHSGGVKVFQGKEQGAKTVVVDLYLTATRAFLFNGVNVECRILREVAFESGQLVEVSDNYFAQADDGSLYYFGEVVDNYEDGVIDNHDGSWLVGGPNLPTDPPAAGTALVPAVFMPALPEAGDIFKPEDLYPLVDETARVVHVNVTVKVPAGTYENAIEIEETSQLEPGATTKWYAPGVGVVMEKAGSEQLNLISSTLVSP